MRIQLSKKISLSAMVSALSLLFLYASAVLPTMRITCLFLSSVFVYVLAGERMYAFSVLAYLSSSALSFLILPDKMPAVLYTLLLGHYGIFKVFMQERIKDKFVCFFLKLIYCDVFAFIIVLGIVFFYANLSLPVQIPVWGWWVSVLVLQVVFISYDVLYSLCARFYDNMLRNYLLPRR